MIPLAFESQIFKVVANKLNILFLTQVITAAERIVTVRNKGGEPTMYRVKIWNDTVANLTLMALG